MKDFARSLRLASAEAFKTADPASKVTPLGYLQYMLDNNTPSFVSGKIDDGSGYIRDAVVQYVQRGVAGQSTTEDDCSVGAQPGILTKAIPTTLFRAVGIAFEDDQMAKLEEDGMAMLSKGTPPTAMMKQIWQVIVNKANGLLQDVNNDLLTIQAMNFGVNKVSGSANAKTIVFPQDSSINNLTQGMTSMLADAYANELNLQGSVIVGAGLITPYMLQQAAKSFDSSGINTNLLTIPKFYFDQNSQPKWGADNFGLFEKDAVQFINICRFRGPKAGLKGTSYFFTLKIPIADSLNQGTFKDFEFDVQMKYRDCPGEEVIDGNVVKLGRGWNVILMCSYQQLNIPTDAYAAADGLYGNNGTYLYHATNPA